MVSENSDECCRDLPVYLDLLKFDIHSTLLKLTQFIQIIEPILKRIKFSEQIQRKTNNILLNLYLEIYLTTERPDIFVFIQ